MIRERQMLWCLQYTYCIQKCSFSTAPEKLRAYLVQAFGHLLADAHFNTSLAGLLPGDASSQGRLQKMRDALRPLSSLET